MFGFAPFGGRPFGGQSTPSSVIDTPGYVAISAAQKNAVAVSEKSASVGATDAPRFNVAVSWGEL